MASRFANAMKGLGTTAKQAAKALTDFGKAGRHAERQLALSADAMARRIDQDILDGMVETTREDARSLALVINDHELLGSERWSDLNAEANLMLQSATRRQPTVVEVESVGMLELPWAKALLSGDGERIIRSVIEKHAGEIRNIIDSKEDDDG